MPIRFRCAYCNQLMGIATRKAGTVVRCPNCAGQVIVPNPVGNQPAPPSPPRPQGLFESSDFENMFDPNRPPSAATAKQNSPSPAEPAIDVEPIPVSPALGPGIYLTPINLTIVSVVLVLLMGLFFLLGFWLGRS